MADTKPMTRTEAIMLRNRMLRHGREMDGVAARKDVRWGLRYEAAVIADDCRDVAKEFDWLMATHPLEN